MTGLLDRLLFWRGKTLELEAGDQVEEGELVPITPEQALEISAAARAEARIYLREINGADLVPPWKRGQPIYTTFSTRKAIKDGLKASSWVYICVDLISGCVSSVPLQVQVLRRGEWIADPSHPLQALLDRPNEVQSRSTLIRLWVTYLLLSGEGYLGKNRAGFPVPQELWAVNTAQITPVAGKEGYLSHYLHQVGGAKTVQPIEDIVSWLWPDPDRQHRGLSKLEIGARVVSVDAKGATWQAASLERMAVPGGVIKDTRVYANLDQFKLEKAKLQAAHMGGENARGTMFLDGGKEFIPLAMTPVELDLINSRKFGRDEILSIFGVPGPVAGVMDKSSYNNILTAHEIFWQTTIATYLREMEETLTQGLAQPDYGDDVRVRADRTRVRHLSRLDKETAEVAKTLWSMGVPVSEVNRRLELGLQPYKGWDLSHPSKPAADEGEPPPPGPARTDDQEQ